MFLAIAISLVMQYRSYLVIYMYDLFVICG